MPMPELLWHRSQPEMHAQKVWQRHLRPAIAVNSRHEIYVHSFASNPDRIRAFQAYGRL